MDNTTFYIRLLVETRKKRKNIRFYISYFLKFLQLKIQLTIDKYELKELEKKESFPKPSNTKTFRNWKVRKVFFKQDFKVRRKKASITLLFHKIYFPVSAV